MPRPAGQRAPRTLFRLAAAALVGAAAVLPANAGRIAIRVDPSCQVLSNRVTVTARVVNQGDEAAESPALSVDWNGAIVAGETCETLPPRAVRVLTAQLGAPPARPGTYTVVLRLRYRDTNGYPFTSLTAAPLDTAVPEPGEPRLALRLEAGRGTLTLVATNAGSHPLTVTVRMATAPELAVTPDAFQLVVPARGAAGRTVGLDRSRARAGSRLRAMAVAAWEWEGEPRGASASALVRVEAPVLVPPAARPWIGGGIAALAAAWLALQRRAPPPRRAPGPAAAVFDALVVAALMGFTLWHLCPSLLVLDTTTVGGDTPAHNYLAAHLRGSLFGRGQIVSWANGWWCGFPMFQFYFCLPYLLMAALSLALPFNIAFKLVSVAGVLLLYPAAYGAGRVARLPRPVPALLAVAMLPVLFDHSHTMWGVNLYSTLAGMLANSLSFPLMLLAIAAAQRDTDDGRFRAGTVLLMAAVIASHFFTAWIMAACALALPFLGPRAGWRRALAVLALEGGIAALLMSWWLVPLVAKGAYAVDFGTNWNVALWKTLPAFARWLLPLAVLAVPLALRTPPAGAADGARRFALVTALMGLAGFVLFRCGYRLSPVFVNVRLWPFMVYAIAALAALGAGLILARSRAPALAVAALLLAAVAWGPDAPNAVRSWARWNYEGLENKPDGPAFRALMDAVRGTPGRLANDLCPANACVGSSRIFELVPVLAGKPILEGGIVNSAWGSIFAYTIQGETSRQSAGYPTLVTPAAFDMTNATRHLRLFNVSHFVARWPGTRRALAAMPEWRLAQTAGEWQLYERTAPDGSYVYVPSRAPVPVRCTNRQMAGSAWFARPAALDRPFVLLEPGEPGPPDAPPPVTQETFSAMLAAWATNGLPPREDDPAAAVRVLEVSDTRIRFRTGAVGRPHIVKCMYYPNWKARGADAVYMVTPGFMLVYPRRTEVELYYGRTGADHLGRLLSACGLGALLAAGTIAGFAGPRRSHARGTG